MDVREHGDEDGTTGAGIVASLYTSATLVPTMLTARQVVNLPVITSDGRIVGKVASATVDDAWGVPYFALNLERNVADAAKIRKPLFGSPRGFLEPAEVDALSDNVILSRKLAEIPDVLRTKGAGMEVLRVLGRPVVGEEDYYFGDLQDVFLDAARWRVSELLVEVRKKAADEMGFPMTLFGTCQAKVPVKRVESLAARLSLGLDPEGFKEYVVKEKARE